MASQVKEFYSIEQWRDWLDRLAENDYILVDNFVSGELYQKIQRYFDSLLEKEEFSKAAIGSADKRQIESSIRGDFIYWLDQKVDTEISDLFVLMDELVAHLKRYLFLSLSNYEFHFAMYPPGTRYQKHVDQFRGKSNRVISVLIYLNEDWQAGDGGELRIYRPDGEELLIEPIAKRLVMFKSETIEQEVMLTHKHRRSLTGWLLH